MSVRVHLHKILQHCLPNIACERHFREARTSPMTYYALKIPLAESCSTLADLCLRKVRWVDVRSWSILHDQSLKWFTRMWLQRNDSIYILRVVWRLSLTNQNCYWGCLQDNQNYLNVMYNPSMHSLVRTVPHNSDPQAFKPTGPGPYEWLSRPPPHRSNAQKSWKLAWTVDLKFTTINFHRCSKKLFLHFVTDLFLHCYYIFGG